MDFKGPFGYKCATLYDKKQIVSLGNMQVIMDEEFLRQMDRVDELIANQLDLDKLDDQTLICECFCVNAGDIRSACAETQSVDIELLKSTYSLGMGCQGCLKKSDYWINRIF